MPRSPLRRLTSGLFALWFALSGGMRGAAVHCPQHAAVAASGAVRHASAMHGASGSSHGGTHGGAHCNCSGDCCGTAGASAQPAAGSLPIALQRTETRRVPSIASRPRLRVDYLLPFPTAPPRTATI